MLMYTYFIADLIHGKFKQVQFVKIFLLKIILKSRVLFLLMIFLKILFICSFFHIWDFIVNLTLDWLRYIFNRGFNNRRQAFSFQNCFVSGSSAVKDNSVDPHVYSLPSRLHLRCSFNFLPLDLSCSPFFKLEFQGFDGFMLVCAQRVQIYFHWFSFEWDEPFLLSCSYILLFCCILRFFLSATLAIISTIHVDLYRSNSCILLLWIQSHLLNCVLHTVYPMFSAVNMDFISAITGFHLQFSIL